MSLDSLTEKEVLSISDEDLLIPTRVARVDAHIRFLKDQHEALIRQIAESESDRALLLKRAKECNITSDNEYKIIEVPTYPKKHVDIDVLKRLAKDKYDIIQQNIYMKLQDKLAYEANKALSYISQADVKAVISDKALLAQIIPEPKEPSSYDVQVVKKE